MATTTTVQAPSKSLDYVSNLQSSNGAPLKLKAFRFYIKTLSKFRPKKAILVLTKIFFTPQRKLTSETQLAEMDSLDREYITFENKELFVLKGGTGPQVLLIHGWGSSSYTFRHLIPRILDAGFSVLAFDAPAHGLSDGKRTNIPEIVRVINQLEEKYGSFHSIVAHSLGCLVSRFANSYGLKFTRLVNLNSPYNKSSVFDPFFYLLGVPESVHDRVTKEIEKVIGVSMAEIFGIHPNYNTGIPTLLIYDKDDLVIPYKDGLELHEGLSNSELILTEGLGHRSALSNPEILNKITEFLLD